VIWSVNLVVRFLSLLIVLRVVASWLEPVRNSEYFRLLRLLTEPLLSPFRRLLYLRGMRFDPSPLLALICLEILRSLVEGILTRGLPR